MIICKACEILRKINLLILSKVNNKEWGMWVCGLGQKFGGVAAFNYAKKGSWRLENPTILLFAI
jgi:hypothetical protein